MMILADLTATFEHDTEDGYYQEHSTGAMTSLGHKVALRYDYATAPQDVFRRHDNCGCRAIYECGNTRQDIWSKQSWTAVDSEASDKAVTYTPPKLTPEQANAIEQEKLSQFRSLTNNDISGKMKVLQENKLFTSLEKSDKENVIKLIENTPEYIVSAFNACCNSFSINPNYSQRGSCYNWNEQIVNVLISKMRTNIYYNVGKGEELFKTAYNEFFHEIGHAIDNAAGRNMPGGFWASNISSTFISQSFGTTLGEMLETEVLKCVNTYERKGMTKILEDMPLIASADISDIFGAFTENEVSAYTGHDVSYYSSDTRAKAAGEAFAEMFSAKINNPKSLESFKKYLPKSYSIFKEILKAIPQIDMRR